MSLREQLDAFLKDAAEHGYGCEFTEHQVKALQLIADGAGAASGGEAVVTLKAQVNEALSLIGEELTAQRAELEQLRLAQAVSPVAHSTDAPAPAAPPADPAAAPQG